VASGVNLHSVKVLDSAGNGSLAGLIEGIEYVTLNHQSPAVAVIGVSTSFSQILNDAVAAAGAAGITYTVPGGDVFADACQYSPGSVSSAITVATSGINDEASFAANIGSCIDLYAPGLSIKSLWHTTDNANNTISHSPMAAAHVAGAAALIRGNDPHCTVTQVRDKLLSQSYDGILTDVPIGTVNRLLGVATTADTGPACAAPVIAPLPDYDHLVQVEQDLTVNIGFLPQGLSLTAEQGSVSWDSTTASYIYTPQAGYIGLDNLAYSLSGNDYVVRVEVGLTGNGNAIQAYDANRHQYDTRIAVLSNGDYVMVWNDYLSNRDIIRYQRFTADGVALTNAVMAYYSAARQRVPSVTGTADGGFMVSWQESGNVYGIRFGADNVVNGSLLTLSSGSGSGSAGGQSGGELVTLNNGSVMSAWDNEYTNHLRGNLYHADGTLLKGAIWLFNDASGNRAEATLMALTDGGFMVAGIANSQVMTQRFDSNGDATGATTAVSLVDTLVSDEYNERKQVSLTQWADGRYVVGWSSTAGQDGDGKTAIARIFAADGSPITGEIVLNQNAVGDQLSLSLAALENGHFMAVWNSNDASIDGDNWAVMGREFDHDGNPVNIEFRVTEHWLSAQLQPSVTVLSNGRIAVSYSHYDSQYKAMIAMVTPGTSNADILQGDNSNDVLIGNGGHNTLYGQAGDDQLLDGTLAFGDDGDDTFYGGITLHGGNGNDTFYGGSVIYGDAGHDDITIGSGDTIVDGGDDFDVVFFSGDYEHYFIEDNLDGSYTVIDQRLNSPQGTNTLTNVEAMEFANDRRSLDITPATPVAWDQLVQLTTDGSLTLDFAPNNSINQIPSHGTLDWDGNAYVYTPEAGFSGVDTFIYQDHNGAQQLVRIEVGMTANSTSFPVTTNNYHQWDSKMAVLDNGDYVMVWRNYISAKHLISYQRFSSDGEALTTVQWVHHISFSKQFAPWIAATADGGFMIT
jgi:hypothetical protein